jgi:hypothetical protein
VRAARHPRDPRLEARAGGRDQQREPEPEQDRDRDHAQEVIRQAEGIDHVDQRNDRERERDHQADDHSERAPPAPGDARRQHRGKHRQHARRQRGAGSGDEREPHQQDH